MRKSKAIMSLCGLVFATAVMAMPIPDALTLPLGTTMEDDPVIIHVVVKESNKPEGAPRSAVPFFAEYYDTLSGVMLGCSESIGDVTVRLTSTAGDWYETVFDTSDGAVLIPASGLSGHYVLTIETADHTVYEGEFYL